MPRCSTEGSLTGLPEVLWPIVGVKVGPPEMESARGCEEFCEFCWARCGMDSGLLWESVGRSRSSDGRQAVHVRWMLAPEASCHSCFIGLAGLAESVVAAVEVLALFELVLK